MTNNKKSAVQRTNAAVAKTRRYALRLCEGTTRRAKGYTQELLMWPFTVNLKVGTFQAELTMLRFYVVGRTYTDALRNFRSLVRTPDFYKLYEAMLLKEARALGDTKVGALYGYAASDVTKNVAWSLDSPKAKHDVRPYGIKPCDTALILGYREERLPAYGLHTALPIVLSALSELSYKQMWWYRQQSAKHAQYGKSHYTTILLGLWDWAVKDCEEQTPLPQ